MEDLIKSYEDKLPGIILDELRKESKKRTFTKKQVQEILDHLLHQYKEALIAPGEPIGIITAESFGEPGTQMTLNVFHFAGVAEVSVTQGLPRLIEILDARKEISTPSMEIFLKAPYNKEVKDVKRVAALIKETQLQEIASEFSINLNKLQIIIELNKNKTQELHITPDNVVTALTEHLKNAKVKKTEDNKIIVSIEGIENELLEIYKLKEKLKSVHVKGIKNITHVLPVKNNNEFVIVTAGSNLKEVIDIKEVDETRTVTNNLFEVLNVFGVEAARQTIINEAKKVIQDQGLDVDIRHIMFVADVMTTQGTVKGITRSGITGEKRSVLARASFETPLKHLINASLINEEDELNSVIENVMLNQPIPLGTGLPGLVAHMKSLTAAQPKPSKKAKAKDDS